MNSNPETVSTDYDTSSRLYFEPLTIEDVLNVIEKERPEGIIIQFGGQTPLKLANGIQKYLEDCPLKAASGDYTIPPPLSPLTPLPALPRQHVPEPPCCSKGMLCSASISSAYACAVFVSQALSCLSWLSMHCSCMTLTCCKWSIMYGLAGMLPLCTLQPVCH